VRDLIDGLCSVWQCTIFEKLHPHGEYNIRIWIATPRFLSVCARFYASGFFALAEELHSDGQLLVSLWNGTPRQYLVCLGLRPFRFLSVFTELHSPRKFDFCVWHSSLRFLTVSS
jgi:hypothetical protein